MRHWLGIGAAVLVSALTLGTLVAVLLRAEGFGNLGPADWAAIKFTVFQAFLSAGISVILAIPVARALARRRFPGRGILITLLGAPFILPVIVAVLGLLAVFGRNGIISVIFGWVGLPPVQIYGLHGVVLAHVFFNLPLATRLLLQGWMSVPSERFRLAASLNFSSRDIFRTVELPILKDIVPGALAVIFVLCTTSFAVALTLGGGPRATTVELAIYQAFRFDFDLGTAATFALIQFGICVVAATFLLWLNVPQTGGAGMDRARKRWDTKVRKLVIVDGIWIISAALFLIVPLVMIAMRGLPGLFDLPSVVWYSAARSVSVALISALTSVALAVSLALMIVRDGTGPWARTAEATTFLAIAASPLVIGTGLFLIIFPIADPRTLTLPVIILVNSVMALPFGVRVLVPAVQSVEGSYGKLADSLGLVGWARWKALLFPRLRRPLGFAAGLAAAMSMGDLGVVALFADSDRATLPLQMYRLMGAYQMEAAAGSALLLMALSVVLFWLFDQGGRVDVDA